MKESMTDEQLEEFRKHLVDEESWAPCDVRAAVDAQHRETKERTIVTCIARIKEVTEDGSAFTMAAYAADVVTALEAYLEEVEDAGDADKIDAMEAAGELKPENLVSHDQVQRECFLGPYEIKPGQIWHMDEETAVSLCTSDGEYEVTNWFQDGENGTWLWLLQRKLDYAIVAWDREAFQKSTRRSPPW